jgi:hypothetical protein
MKAFHLHAALAACWLTIALAIAISTALLGNEEAVLAKQRGADLKRRDVLRYEHDRLRSAVDWQASPPVLRETMRRVGLTPAGEEQALASR